MRAFVPGSVSSFLKVILDVVYFALWVGVAVLALFTPARMVARRRIILAFTVSSIDSSSRASAPISVEPVGEPMTGPKERPI